MRRILLKSPSRFVNPSLVNRIRCEGLTLSVGADGVSIVFKPGLGEAEIYTLTNALPAGTTVRIDFERDGLKAIPIVDIEAERDRARRVHEAEMDAHNARLEAKWAKARVFNATLPIPVRWAVGYKAVLSGLVENSNLSGENKRSVDHVLLCEAINEPRFARRAGDFLCTSRSGDNGMEYVSTRDLIERAARGDDGKGSPVTCKTCLRLARRWNA